MTTCYVPPRWRATSWTRRTWAWGKHPIIVSRTIQTSQLRWRPGAKPSRLLRLQTEQRQRTPPFNVETFPQPSHGAKSRLHSPKLRWWQTAAMSLPSTVSKTRSILRCELLCAHCHCLSPPSTLLRHDVEMTKLLEKLGRHGWKIPPCRGLDWFETGVLVRSLSSGNSGNRRCYVSLTSLPFPMFFFLNIVFNK